MWGFRGVSHGFLSPCVRSSHFSTLGMSSCIKQAAHQADDLGIWHLCSNPCSFWFSYAPWDSFSPCPWKTRARVHSAQQDGAQQAFPMVMTTYYTVLFNNSPRKHSQASSLSQKIAGGQIKSKKARFLTAPPVTPALTDRTGTRVLQGQNVSVKAHLQNPTYSRLRRDLLCCSSLAVFVATEMPAGRYNS